jgi:aquaporin Z
MATRKTKSSSAQNTTRAAKVTNKTRVVKSTKLTSSKAASASNESANLISQASFGAMFAEFIGTFLLAAVAVSVSGQPIFIFFALVAIALTIGHLSGSHVNPAITFGAWINRKISTVNAVGYIVAQVLGGMLALVVLNALVGGAPGQQNPLTGQPQAAELFKSVQTVGGKEWYAFFASMLGLGIFGFAFASALRERKEHIAAAFTVGGGLFIGLIVAGQAAILNPAVALTLQSFTDLKGDSALAWGLAIHVVAPLIGAAIGFFLYDLFRRDVDTTV